MDDLKHLFDNMPKQTEEEMINIRDLANKQIDGIIEKWATKERNPTTVMLTIVGLADTLHMLGEEKGNELLNDMIAVFVNVISNKLSAYSDLNPSPIKATSNN